MSAPQGLFYFSGLKGLLQGRFCVTDGVQPALAELHIPPQDTPLPAIGDLIVSYAGGGAIFPQCRITSFSFDVDDTGREVWIVRIADARWRWKYARISGEYNVRDDNGNPKAKQVADSRKLAKLLFQALKVEKFDLGDLPEGFYPEKHWAGDRADVELESLCAAQGCRVVPLSGGKFIIKGAGRGARLPKSAETMSFSDAVNPPELPESIVFEGGPDIYQMDLELEAVGEELDGTVKLLDELSYRPKPEHGWDIPHFMNVDSEDELRTRNRDVAKQFAFRLFRIKTPFTLPTYNGPNKKDRVVDDIKRICPITDRQVYRAKVLNKVETLPAVVYGKFYRDSHQQKSDFESDSVDPQLARSPEQKWHGGVSVIAEKGLVLLGEYCRQIDEDTGFNVPPKIFIRTSFSVRDPETFAFVKKQIERRLSRQPNGTPKLFITRDEVCLVTIDRDQDGQAKNVDNLTKPIDDLSIQGPTVLGIAGAGQFSPQFPSLTDYANYYIDGAIRDLNQEDATSCRYGGFLRFDLDGAVRQIIYEVDEEGKATTQLSRNTEILGPWPSRAQREYNAKAAAIADQADKQKLQAAKLAASIRRLK